MRPLGRPRAARVINDRRRRMLALEVGEDLLEGGNAEARVVFRAEFARARVEDRDRLRAAASLQAHVGNEQIEQSLHEPGIAPVVKSLTRVFEVTRVPARYGVTVKGERTAHKADQALRRVE